MSSIEDLKALITQAAPTNPFAVSYLQLCQAAALAPSQIPTAVSQVPPLNAGGFWKCTWGPAQDSDQSNLAFVAVYYYAPGLPVLAAVTIRGTDVDVNDGWGIVEQIWEDLDVTNQQPLPWAPGNPARVANGTLLGLSVLQSLTSGGQTMQTYLTSFLGNPANNNPVLIVTGHSLGGCLTTVVAPWLQNTLGGTLSNLHIVPATFAAPTAGNAAFATYFQNSFSYSLRYYNSLDIVPLAWWNIGAVDSIYQPCGLSVPDLVYLGVLGFEDAMYYAGVSYAQPSTNSSQLNGSCYPTSSWYDEAAYQHHTSTYLALLGGTSIAQPVVRRSTRSRLRERMGPLPALLAKSRRC